jgi:hypothetical protein
LALGWVFLLECSDEDVALGHGSPASRAAIIQCGIRPRIAQTFFEIVRGLRFGVGAA